MAVGEGSQQDYVEALEMERRKIQMFARELPLCLQLVTGAIKNCRRRMANEEACRDVPVLEEFIPLRPSSASLGSDGSLHEDGESPSNCKPDWLRSVKLWGSPAAEEPPVGGSTLRKPVAVNARKIGGAFQPFEREKQAPAAFCPSSSAHPAITVTTMGNMPNTIGERGVGSLDEKEKEEGGEPLAPATPHRKQRRCWSPDLHCKFLRALEQLGGSGSSNSAIDKIYLVPHRTLNVEKHNYALFFAAATPKQIRELMKVEGLTNDEVKSHLQKYRLHSRRPVATVHNSSPQIPTQFMVVGGIWVSPPDYAAATQSAEGSSAVMNEIYSPAASVPLELALSEDQQNKKLKKTSESNSCSTSSNSSHTTTASPSA